MLKVFNMGTLGKLAMPIGGHVLTDQISLAIFVEDRLRIIPVKLG